MRRMLLLTVMTSSLLLQGCALGQLFSKPPATIQQEVAQTRVLVPTVNCGEDAPYEREPAYPVPPVDEGSLSQVTAYAEGWQDWSIDADAVLAREQGKRRAIGTCLAQLRTQGLIN